MHQGLRGPGRASGRGWLARIKREHIKWVPALCEVSWLSE